MKCDALSPSLLLLKSDVTGIIDVVAVFLGHFPTCSLFVPTRDGYDTCCSCTFLQFFWTLQDWTAIQIFHNNTTNERTVRYYCSYKLALSPFFLSFLNWGVVGSMNEVRMRSSMKSRLFPLFEASNPFSMLKYSESVVPQSSVFSAFFFVKLRSFQMSILDGFGGNGGEMIEKL